MISAGYFHECVQVSGVFAKSAMDELSDFGIEKLSIGDMRDFEWEVLEMKIKKWIRATKVSDSNPLRDLFSSRRFVLKERYVRFERESCARVEKPFILK
ncbi:hypothetical protein LOK49_LG02G00556 [Camellia lanceoleosa]|uniref:Uncharacterized protein n=1 Tax=Camellia lanceoleosa TaxID=1840588 RepID=A0ACC0IM84_9ERIC|nr:hypothetical protein LOK49_LG02G00556 [Camellia lanceoleosa]